MYIHTCIYNGSYIYNYIYIYIYIFIYIYCVHTQQYQASRPLASLEIGMGIIFVVLDSPDPAADDDAKVVLVHLFCSFLFL